MGYGAIDPNGVWYMVRSEGIVEYDNDFEAWDMNIGAGITYAMDGFACTFMPMYTHREFRQRLFYFQQGDRGCSARCR